MKAGHIGQKIRQTCQAISDRMTLLSNCYCKDATEGIILKPANIPVVGIGASAGALPAFKSFFQAVPADSGIAFVLIPHLDPNHRSLMAELVGKHTQIKVLEATDSLLIEPDHAYVIPPNKYMTIANGTLRLTGPTKGSQPATSIDIFLRSLAEEKQEKAICVILSGTGAHGTLGVKAIKSAGGLALVQEPESCEYPAMPRNAIMTGLVDFVLPPNKMPEALLNYIKSDYINLSTENDKESQWAEHISQILQMLKSTTKLDFHYYRKRMLTRRIDRRMSLSLISNLPDYITYLRDHVEEQHLLARDLLVSVTNFFRDADAWQTLESEVIAPLIGAKANDGQLRIWHAGCATGEEAYSMGILAQEQLTTLQKTCNLQIFATDIDERALEVARKAIYPDTINTDVSHERLSRFFTKLDESTYQVSGHLRDSVTFARHNLLADPPFSKLDVAVCRNVLIYLEPDVQRRIIELMHFSLNPDGLLFLGSSETIGREAADMFEPISSKWRIYRRIGASKVHKLQIPASYIDPVIVKTPPAERTRPATKLAELAHESMMRRFSLASVVVDRNHEILHFAGPTENYLRQPSGPPTKNILSLASPGLEPKLRVLIQRALRENAPQTILSALTEQQERINIYVEPLNASKQTEGLLLISFQDEPASNRDGSDKHGNPALPADTEIIRQIEQELESTREDLQNTIEDLETSNEDLKASNEEVLSMNEELQSANEELESSKEELQSLNEELSTVNSQLQEKIQELETINNDMSNLLNSSDISTVFLDSLFRIKRFTPAATQFFNFITSDVGRPIGDIVKRFEDDELYQDLEKVLRELTPRVREVRIDKRWWLRRIVPYRTSDNRIEGVVITFVDITERKRSQDSIANWLAAIIEGNIDAIVSQDLDGTIKSWNKGAETLYGFRTSEVKGRSIKMTVPEDHLGEWDAVISRIVNGDEETFETMQLRKGGHLIPVSVSYSPLRDSEGNVVGASMIARDISEQKRMQAELLQQQEELRNDKERSESVLTSVSDAIITLDEDGKIQTINPATEQMFLYTAGEMIGQNISMLLETNPLETNPLETNPLETNPLETNRSGHTSPEYRFSKFIQNSEIHVQRKDGTVLPAELTINRIDHLNLHTAILHDITIRKQLELDLLDISIMEQRRIGQNLHDHCGQQLAAIGLIANGLAAGLKTGMPNGAEIASHISVDVQTTLQELRDICRGLEPVDISQLKLNQALNALAVRVSDTPNVRCIFASEADVILPDKIQATQLYYIAKEACSNAIKHSNAKNIQMHLRKTNNQVELRISDDGAGIGKSDSAGLGTRIMHTRASIIGAKLKVESRQPRGTTVSCAVKVG